MNASVWKLLLAYIYTSAASPPLLSRCIGLGTTPSDATYQRQNRCHCHFCFTCELRAIIEALDLYNTLRIPEQGKGLVIFCDSKAAMPVNSKWSSWITEDICSYLFRLQRILFSDEAHFWLNGYVNKQNCRIWSEANPQVYVETPLHPEKLTVWCALWAGGIIGPYFFKNDEGHNVTVNGDRYRAMITNFFIPELNNPDVQEVWFQQDGAACHTARATIDLLKDTFGDRRISRFGHVNWPPRSCDLTQVDYIL
ncbi:transposable element Tc3 transposase [Trichonephila clavipes]|nr:transposable element Tc3 transposase [Trichonephila clavipes]